MTLENKPLKINKNNQYVGNLVNGIPEGIGKLIRQDWTLLEGMFRQGDLVSWMVTGQDGSHSAWDWGSTSLNNGIRKRKDGTIYSEYVKGEETIRRTQLGIFTNSDAQKAYDDAMKLVNITPVAKPAPAASAAPAAKPAPTATPPVPAQAVNPPAPKPIN